VAGNAALLVNPENVFEIQRGLQRVLLDPALRAQMKQRGYEQAQRFSWTTSVSRILEIYREVADDRVSRGSRGGLKLCGGGACPAGTAQSSVPVLPYNEKFRDECRRCAQSRTYDN